MAGGGGIQENRGGRVPTEEEIHIADGEMLAAIDRIYPYRSAALKRCKVALAAR
jgi:hypothetical protein